MSILLYRLGGVISRRRGVVVGAWLLLLVLLGTGASTLGDRYDDSFSIPGTDSQKGQDLLAQRFGQTGANGQILFTAKKGKITDSANASEVGKLVKATDAIKGCRSATPSPRTSRCSTRGPRPLWHR